MQNDPDLPELTKQESEWTGAAKQAVYDISRQYKINFATAIKRVYSVMSKQYGVHWDHVTDEVLKACGKPPGTPITRLRTIAYEPKLRNLFDTAVSKLRDTYNIT